MFRSIAPRLAAAALMTAALGLSACNTVAGAGKDASALGHDVTRGADSGSNAITNKTGASQN